MFTSNRAIVQRRGSASLFLLGARVHPAVGPSHSHLLSVTTCRSYAASVSDDGTRRRSMWLLKELREVTEASITDVRAAIQQCGENKDACIAYLQECGAAKALVKNTREARQGVVLAGTIPDVCAYCIEVGTETDFAARSEKFLKYCAAIGSCVQSIASQCALVCGSEAMEAFLVSAIEDQTKDIHAATTAAISERIGVRKVRVLTWPIDAPRPLKVGSGKHQCKLFLEGKPLEDFTEYHFGSYAHSLSPIEYPSSSPVRVGTVVALSSLSLPFSQRPVESELLDRTLRSLAQHIVATAGMYGEDLTQRGEGVALHKSTVVPLSEQKYLGDGEQISEWVSKQLGSKARVVQGLLVRVGE